MGIGDYVDRAKRALAGNEDKVADAIDKVAGAAKSRTSASTDAKIDRAADKARDFLEQQKREGRDHPPARHTERPDPPAL